METIRNVCCCCCSSRSGQTLLLEESDSGNLNFCVSGDRNRYRSMNDSSSDVRPSCSLSSSSVGGHHRYQFESRFSKSCKISDNEVTITPQLDCFIIPSFGKDTPDNVAMKKMAGDFLKGVGDDFEIIKQLIKNDSCKHLYEVEFMCHFAQKEIADFTKTIEDAMKDLKMKRKGCKCMHEE